MHILNNGDKGYERRQHYGKHSGRVRKTLDTVLESNGKKGGP